jgi:hypothetical protein
MSRNAFSKQIENRNFLSPLGFKFTLNRAPKVAFFSNSANIPGLTLGVTRQPNYLKDIEIPGDKIEFEDFSLRFLVDENLENYTEIQNWIRGLGYPESLQEIYDFQSQGDLPVDSSSQPQLNLFSDGSLQILTSRENPQFRVNFKDMFPYNLSSLQFDATSNDIEYFTAEVTFKYTIYTITDLAGNKI